MYEITREQFDQMMPNGAAAGRLAAHWPYVNKAIAEFGIATPLVAAAFFAQLAHESGEYRYMEELASGEAYEGREDLGNIYPGDGKRYKGRGPIQLTGRANYKLYGSLLGLPLVDFPDLLTKPEHGTRSAACYWNHTGLTPLAERDDFREITRRINGGYKGWDDRVEHWERCKRVLEVDGPAMTAEDPGPSEDRVLRKGDVGELVIALQAALNKAPDTRVMLQTDGNFGNMTENAVREFQRAAGITPDGIVGRMTWDKLAPYMV